MMKCGTISLPCLFSSLSFVFFRSQAARGKEKDKEGTTESGIKLEPVPGLPGGKGVAFISEADLPPWEGLELKLCKQYQLRIVEAVVSPKQLLTVGLWQIHLEWEVSFV